jgi:hypothetical protein
VHDQLWFIDNKWRLVEIPYEFNKRIDDIKDHIRDNSFVYDMKNK